MLQGRERARRGRGSRAGKETGRGERESGVRVGLKGLGWVGFPVFFSSWIFLILFYFFSGFQTQIYLNSNQI